jgi:hypothetical protein
MLDGLAEVSRSGVLHLTDDESSDLGWGVIFTLSLNPSIAVGVGDDFERDIVNVLLDLCVLEFTTDQPGEGGGRRQLVIPKKRGDWDFDHLRIRRNGRNPDPSIGTVKSRQNHLYRSSSIGKGPSKTNERR